MQATQDAFKTVGVANVPLHVYALVGKTSENVKLQLSWCLSERAYLIVNITPVFEGKVSQPIE